MRKARQEIDYSFNEWIESINNKTFKEEFPSGIQSVGVLTKIPKNYDENNPASAFLKMKGFCTKEEIADKEIIEVHIKEIIISIFKTTKPLVDFLNKAIENSYKVLKQTLCLIA